MKFHFPYFFCYLFLPVLIFALDESEKFVIKQKINKHCKNYLNAVCCSDNFGSLISGSNGRFNPIPPYQHPISSPPSNVNSFGKVAIFQGIDENLEKLLQFLPSNMEHIKIVGSRQILHIPFNVITRFPALQTLDLSFNSIKEISEHAFLYGGTNLKELNLGHNQISSMPNFMKAFQYLRNLQSLYLNENRYLKLEGEQFPLGFGKLEFLDLSFCNIGFLNEKLFEHLKNLKTLRLDGNTLSTIPQSLCHKPTSLKIYFAKTHISETSQNSIIKECTIEADFHQSPIPMETNFKIVEDDGSFSAWFYLFLFSQLCCVSIVIYLMCFPPKKLTSRVHSYFHPERLANLLGNR